MYAALLAAQASAALPASLPYVSLSRVFAETYQCSEHFEGELTELGDALGTDCLVTGGLRDGKLTTPGFNGLYRNDGSRNEDWYSWRAVVRAGVAGTVVAVHSNTRINVPGTMNPGRAASVILKRAEDDTMVVYAHLQDIVVKAGEDVVAGQPIGLVGNNGYSRNPHVHVGAWRGQTPLQIRWNLRREVAE
ncbi:peptidoglycan DD-metalloendopeptidase family protein [Qipengyuania sediminis]|uniref:peptidoglycan DD-metalloendopeptidase family protein n=1 Tax=Qipengyuania sediminis TaxID=1532023 RepID=UPI001059631B|nr:peptidoglycan DD-metalloendopeptidase family protein [Qipengyuania sediminis]